MLSLRLLSLLPLFLAMLALFPSEAAGMQRGLAWGTNDNWGTRVTGGLYSWYWHWQDGPNTKFAGKLEFVPCFWGRKYLSKWQERKAEMASKLPNAILAFNEPDIASQSNMSPSDAANLFKQELQPYRTKGVRVSSPQIVWNVDWLASFMSELKKQGCDVDFIALHWYGAHNELYKLKSYVQTVRQRFNKPIWITEYGVTSSGGGTQQQIKQFHMDATRWLDSQSYVERASNFGAFAISQPPDSYGNSRNALFNSDGSLRDLAYFYVYSNKRSTGDEKAVINNNNVAEANGDVLLSATLKKASA